MRELAAVLSGRPPLEGYPAKARALTGPAFEGDVPAGSAPTSREAVAPDREIGGEQDCVVDLDLLERIAPAEVGCHFLG